MLQLEGPTTEITPVTHGHTLGLFSQSHTNLHSSYQPLPFEGMSPGILWVKLFQQEGHPPADESTKVLTRLTSSSSQ